MKPSGGAKLGDFGVAGELSGRAHASTMVGTVSYMSPEQDDGMATAKSDIYSLGAVLFETWTGTRAPAFARKEPTWPPAATDDAPLRQLIDAMLHETPDIRPAAAEVIEFLGGRSVLAATPPAMSSDTSRRPWSLLRSSQRIW